MSVKAERGVNLLTYRYFNRNQETDWKTVNLYERP